MKLFLRGLAVLWIATFSPLATAQQLIWIGGSVGDFDVASNWNTSANGTGTSGIPNSSTLAAVYPDNLFGGGPYVITINMSQNNTVLGFQVSHAVEFFGANNAGSVTLASTNNSTLAVAGTATAGTGAYLTGDLIVDSGITLTNSGGNLAVTTGVIVVGDLYAANNGFNTFNGQGTLDVSSGTFTFDPAAGSTTEMDVASGGGSVGTINQGVGAKVATPTTPATAATSSFTTTGNILNIGYGGGNGTWNVTNGSTLTTGVQAGVHYVIAVGANTTGTAGAGFFTSTGLGSVGNLNIQDTSSLAITSGNDLQLGTVATIITGGGATALTGGRGIVTQSGSSTVGAAGTATIEIGDARAGVGIYNLQGGTLSIGTAAGDSANLTIGANGSTGTLNQTGGAFVVGDSNPADINTSTFDIGGPVANGGTGTYTMAGGTAAFYNGLVLGATGTINVNGGTLTIADNKLTGTGTINFGGGTLALTAGAGPVYNYGFAGTLTAGTSTIDVSAAGLTTFNFANALSGNGTTSGGIILVGNGATVFNFASTTGGAANTYTGSTGIVGGTLNATVADLSSAANGSMLEIGTAAAPATLNLYTGTTVNPTLKQAIIGSGTLNVNFSAANPTLTLTSLASSLSTVNIVLGAATYPNAVATTGTLTVFGGAFGTVSDNGTGSSVIIGTNGSVVFGTTSYTGSTTVSQNSALTAGNLDGNVVNAGILNVTGAIGLTGANTVMNNVGANTGARLTAGSITGALTNDLGGTVVVTGAAGIGGDVTNGGTVIDAAGIGGNVTNTGTLSATSALSMNNTGSLKTAVPLTTFAITNDFTQTAPGSFTINVAGAQSDKFTATTAELAGVVFVRGASASTTMATMYDIVTTTGAPPVDNGLTTVNSFLLNTSLAVVGNNLVLSVTTNPFIGSTPNQQALANSLNGSPNNPITIAVTNNPTLTAADEPAILQSLLPETFQYGTFINIENVNYLVQRVNGMESDLRNGNGGLDTNAVSVVTPGFESGMGRSLGQLLAYNDPGFHSSAPNGVNYYPGESGRSSPSPAAQSTEPATFDSSTQVMSDSPNPYLADVKPGTSETPRLNEFIGGDVVLADLNQNPSANANSKASYTAGNVTAGVSFRVSNHFAAGILFDYSHTDADTDNNGGKTKIDSYTPGIFATYFDKGFYANGLFTFGYNDYEYDKNTFLGPTSGSPGGQQYTGDLDAGYDFHPAKNWIVGPTIGVTYTHVDVDSFTEQGAPGAALNVDSQSVDSLRSRLGGHVTFQTNTGDVLLQPSLTAMWQHEYLDDSRGITSSFSNTTLNPFTIETAAPSRDSALIGIGLTATLSNSMALYINYLADVGAENYFSQSVIGGIKARF